MIVEIWECNSCGRRYPIALFYPMNAPHCPGLDCHAELGWTKVRETQPPTANQTGCPPSR